MLSKQYEATAAENGLNLCWDGEDLNSPQMHEIGWEAYVFIGEGYVLSSVCLQWEDSGLLCFKVIFRDC